MAAGTIELTQSVAVTHDIPLRPVQIRRGPVLQLHPQRQSARGQHFLDLVERLAAEIGGLEQLRLGALDQVADVIDVLRLETIGRAHRELEVVDRAQQDWSETTGS